MTDVWLSLTSGERNLLHKALAAYLVGEAANAEATNALAKKIEKAKSRRCITVHLKGGFVEDVKDTPLPIRVYDYDSEGVEELDTDECGRPCIVSDFKPDYRA